MPPDEEGQMPAPSLARACTADLTKRVKTRQIKPRDGVNLVEVEWTIAMSVCQLSQRLMRQYTVVFLVLAAGSPLAGCATIDRFGGKAANSAEGPAKDDSLRASASEVAVQPLRDVGVVRRKIPPALARISDPYAPPADTSCAWISYEIQQLSAVLPGDVAPAPGHDDRSAAEKGTDAAKDGANAAVRGVGSMLVPQRSLVRLLTGASKADRLYAEAEQRGMVRRAYLRGLSQSKGC